MRRTTATTDYLKECMGTALLELMKEKPIEKISIEEMTAKADVGRSTYFRYFKSKDERKLQVQVGHPHDKNCSA